ncbi:dienelactone hydrolase-like enzyme [Frankia casuarinae]|uniref:Carboxymethylenebutenolidase n=1 Tax=Frankia casuarinae (strain DSM 45818 / CECT 9043 / HFP020203 / CcI3) TaxID=106370 RepID=Q2J9R6_FRACC|nr:MULTISPECIES: dienelactone hydrolase family protein [Frankia]ABD11976.1 Carboxymethylenebutenolidase [Frankia casuarinae]ETA01883.1 dienelactone hydrolase-like enzyme [Frankia sp. CcI6]EYT92506.1 dienelactone hydrolase-like enzyme [Frankia casuarinae]KDA43020.1 dienelactone hydrolase-like enzyme [Frankia sp. BMG5.23]KFB04497.1 dienelactone hydrolase-like enzyme [Frankia sp. Allo2]
MATGTNDAASHRTRHDGEGRARLRAQAVRGRGGLPLTVLAPAAKDPPRGGLVVVQDARGITPYLVSVCDRLAAAGWLTVAPHLYHRDGLDEVDPADGWAAATSTMGTLSGAGIDADIDAALGHLLAAGFPAERSAIIGFCMGGTVALHTATRHTLAAAVSFYGGGISTPYWPGIPALVEAAPSLRGPWLGLYGEEDALISTDEIAALRAAAARSGAPTELVSYAGAGHAFHSDDREALYRPVAAADGWSRALAFLDRHVRPR